MNLRQRTDLGYHSVSLSEWQTSQAAIIATVRALVDSSAAELASANEGHRGLAIAGIREVIRDMRVMEGKIHDPQSWQEIHTLVDDLERRISGDSNADSAS